MPKPALVTPAQMLAVLETTPKTTVRSELPLIRQVSAKPPPRTLSFICSTEGTKRDGHRIVTAGWQLDNFKRTGAPVLWCHDVSQPAIGIAPTMRVEGKQLVTEVTFASPEDYAFADTVYRLYAADPPIMRAGSVQWGPLKWEPNLDEQGRQIGLTYTEQELYEFSLCPVPADPDAIMRAIQQRQVTGDEVERLVRRVTPGVSVLLVRLNDAESEDRHDESSDTHVPPLGVPSSLPSASSQSVTAEPKQEQSVTPPHSVSPLPTVAQTPAPRARGPLADAMAADDEANLWEAIDDVGRCHNTMLRLVYNLAPGAQDNAMQVDAMLRECDDMMRPMLLTIANNQAKRTIPATALQQRGERGRAVSPPPVLSPSLPPPPVQTAQERLALLTAQKAAEQAAQQAAATAARLNKLKQPVTSPPPSADVPDETRQQQLYFDRSPEAHASIAARVRQLKQG